MTQMSRFLIAIDEHGVHLRETLNVTHDAVAGEAIYHTRPITAADLEGQITAALQANSEADATRRNCLRCALTDLRQLVDLVDPTS